MIKPQKIYQVGKYKDYRKLVGLEQVKHHAGDPSLNMSQKRRRDLTADLAHTRKPPT